MPARATNATPTVRSPAPIGNALAVDADLECLRARAPAPERDLEGVMGVEREAMSDRQPAAGAERELFAHAVALYQDLGGVVGLDLGAQ